MKYNINVEKIRENKNKIRNEVGEIHNLCRECYNKIDATIEFFDTPTAKKFRDKAIELIGIGEIYINDGLIPFIDNLDNCTQMYEDLVKEIDELMRAMYMNTGTPIPYSLQEKNSYTYEASSDFYSDYEDN